MTRQRQRLIPSERSMVRFYSTDICASCPTLPCIWIQFQIAMERFTQSNIRFNLFCSAHMISLRSFRSNSKCSSTATYLAVCVCVLYPCMMWSVLILCPATLHNDVCTAAYETESKPCRGHTRQSVSRATCRSSRSKWAVKLWCCIQLVALV